MKKLRLLSAAALTVMMVAAAPAMTACHVYDLCSGKQLRYYI